MDEENIEESPTNQATAGAASKSELDINSKFEEFWRAGREKAKEKKLRRAKETHKSESESGNVPTSTIITPTITTTPPHSTNKSRPSLWGAIKMKDILNEMSSAFLTRDTCLVS